MQAKGERGQQADACPLSLRQDTGKHDKNKHGKERVPQAMMILEIKGTGASDVVYEKAQPVQVRDNADQGPFSSLLQQRNRTEPAYEQVVS